MLFILLIDHQKHVTIGSNAQLVAAEQINLQKLSIINDELKWFSYYGHKDMMRHTQDQSHH